MKRTLEALLVLVTFAAFVSAGHAYTKPNTYRAARVVCTNPFDPSTCTVTPSALVFKEQIPFSPHSWVIPKAIALLRAQGLGTEADLAQKYLLPMLEGVTFNDVWGDADMAGASVLDYYVPASPETNNGYGCVLDGFVFAPYKNCTNTHTIPGPNNTRIVVLGFDRHPLYGYGNAAEHAQFRYDYARRIYLDEPSGEHWGSDPRDKMAGWVIDTIAGQDDPFDERWASGAAGIDSATAPGGTQSRFGAGKTPATALLDLFQNHTNTEVVFPEQSDDALSTIHVPTDEVFSHAPEWLDDHFGDADDVEAYMGWDGHDNAVYANWTLDASGHCNGGTDCAAPMVVRLPVNSKAHAFFNLGWAIHLLEDNTTPVHTVNGSGEAFKRHNDVESLADAVLRDTDPMAVSAGIVKDLLPAATLGDFTKLYDYPPPTTSNGDTCGAPDPSTFWRDTWWAGSLTLQASEGVAHGYTRSVAEIAQQFMVYIRCIDTEADRNWPSMGVFTALGLDNAIKATAGLIRQFIEDVDKTAPTLAVFQPTATTYPHNATLTLSYSAAVDSESGVKSVTPTLDGNTMVGGHGLTSGQTINLLTDLLPGDHTFTVTSVDNAGNVAAPAVTFSIVVTPDSIKGDVQQFLTSGAIKNAGEANSLSNKLNAAAAARVGGNCSPAANIYQSFIDELQAQSGKGVDATAAAIMIADARYLIAHCS